MSLYASGLAAGRRAFTGGLASLVLALALTLVMLVAAPVQAQAGGKYSSIVVDARTGKIISSSDPDGIRHPASLTKMMTLYILFQDLKAGKIKLDSPIRMSARAASMAPTKLGVKPGKSITVEIAIKALVVKSANDVAAAVAENLGGSESEFAARMTRTARSIGMSRTTFKNASGLPNPAQVTTARDMATLGLRLMRDFPQYYPYFRTMSFTYAGRTIATHNRLLKNYEGTDGIKTGYINASGYNLVSSVRRGDKRLVGVVMGGKTGASRNAHMMKILTAAFPKSRGGKAIAALAGSSKGAIDPVAEEAPEAETKSAEAAETQPASKKKKKSVASLLTKKQPEESAAEAETPDAVGDADTENEAAQGTGTTIKQVEVPPASTEPQVIEGAVGASELPKNLPFEVKPEAPQQADGQAVASLPEQPGWSIQIGSYATKKDAQAQLLAMRGKLPIVFQGKQAFTVTVEKGEETTYRAQFSGFDEKSAGKACRAVVKQNSVCQVLAPAS